MKAKPQRARVDGRVEMMMEGERARSAEQPSGGRIIQGAPIREVPANPYEAGGRGWRCT
jgi:hypothetical protein